MLVLCGLLLIACVYDYTFRRIPNYLLVGIFIAGIVNCFYQTGDIWLGFFQVVHYLVAAMIVTLCFFPVYRIGALGAGDVKLFAVCAGFFSDGCILYFLFSSLLVSAIFILVRFMVVGDMKERFHYLFQYTADVVLNGGWKLYINDKEEKKKCSICLAGPILCSVLMHLGGVY